MFVDFSLHMHFEIKHRKIFIVVTYGENRRGEQEKVIFVFIYSLNFLNSIF